MPDIRVCICGGGRTGHLYLGLLKQVPNVHVSLLTRNSAAIRRALAGRGIKLTMPDGDVLSAIPDNVSSVPEDVVPNADVVILALPAHVRPGPLRAIASCMPKSREISVGAIPGSAGFDWLAAATLPDHVVIWGLKDVPYTCYGLVPGESLMTGGGPERAWLGFHDRTPEDRRQSTRQQIEHLFRRPFDVADSFLALTLALGNPILHLPALYGLVGPYSHNREARFGRRIGWWKDIGELGAYFIERCAEEQYAVIEAIRERYGLQLASLRPLCEDIVANYGAFIEDRTNLYSVLRSNRAFKGEVPLRNADAGDGFVLDLRSRIFQEDTSYGLALLVEMARRLGLSVPHMMEVWSWSRRFVDVSFGSAVDSLPAEWPSHHKPPAISFAQRHLQQPA